MSSGKPLPNEITIFSLNAQVYALDKSQKWSPLTQDIVPISFLSSSASNPDTSGSQSGTPSTRIFCALESGQVLINSPIHPNMQYRRPSETFVQWFTHDHILYGLNLVSVADAEGFEREFEIASGKRARQPKQAPQNSPSSSHIPSKSANSSVSSSSGMATTSNMSLSSVKQKETGLNSSSGPDDISEHMAKTTLNNTSSANNSNNSGSGSDAKIILGLKARVKELELQNIALEADRTKLSDTVASQTKLIATQQNTIKQLEVDVDKLKTAYQQNSANVAVWKQQLSTYQEVNDSLSSKMTELAELYEKFGEILKRV